MVKHCLVFFGGLNHRVRYNDVWIYDTKQQVWTELKVSAKDTAEDVPPPRAHQRRHDVAVLVRDRVARPARDGVVDLDVGLSEGGAQGRGDFIRPGAALLASGVGAAGRRTSQCLFSA